MFSFNKLKPAAGWRLNILSVSKTSWAWIFWLGRVAEVFWNFCCVWLTIGLLISHAELAAFKVVFWPVVFCSVAFLICNGARACIILRHSKRIWGVSSVYSEMEEAALIRAKKVLK